jgi:hypothetical protein
MALSTDRLPTDYLFTEPLSTMPTLYKASITILVGFALLYASTLHFGKSAIENDLTRRISQNYLTRGVPVVSVSYVGRDGTVRLGNDAFSDEPADFFEAVASERRRVLASFPGVRVIRVHLVDREPHTVPESLGETSLTPGYDPPETSTLF